jgi:aminopeptidase N
VANTHFLFNRLSPIELTAYTLPGRKHETAFALNCARKALHYYADLFQIDYPMPKLDLVAVPDLFYPAMEDWALILFKVINSKLFQIRFSFLFKGRRNVNK